MPGFDAIIDQERPIRILVSLLTNGTIPHALLFTGIEGVGKRTAATAFAMACNCTAGGGGRLSGPQAPETTAEACGACASCRRIAAGHHPDVLRMAPAGLQIKIDQIRELCQVLSMKPYEARIRVAIIAEAQRMNAAAGNALLKMLEEPPAGTVLILTASQPADLLPTIVSRCQHLRFKPLARHHLAAVLHKAYGIPPQEASLAAEMAQGSVTRALALQRGQWIRRRSWLAAELGALSRQSTTALLSLAEKLALDKGDLPEYLDLMTAWVRDLAVARHAPERIIQRDFQEQLVAISATTTDGGCLQAMRALQDASRRLQANAAPRLTLERLLLNMAAALRPADG